MDILSFQESHGRDALQLDAPLARALEMLWQAHRYAADAGMDAWDFAVEIDEFRRARIGNSELRWLLYQRYVAHAIETPPRGRRRHFRRTPSISLSEASCFIIAKAGLALVQSWDAASPAMSLDARKSASLLPLRAIESNRDHKRHKSAVVRPWWDAQRRELWIDGRLVKRLRQQSSNQQAILDAFAAAGWPQRIADPLPLVPAQCPKRRLHDAIKCLNRHHRHEAIRFSGDGSGGGVLWERIS